MKYDI